MRWRQEEARGSGGGEIACVCVYCSQEWNGGNRELPAIVSLLWIRIRFMMGHEAPICFLVGISEKQGDVKLPNIKKIVEFLKKKTQ